ncbi:hypothetical protein QEH59_02440 [Coraliomargarita sp. SDUM461004]|uniref:Transposase n=1 Tax=Thalassobacterium sedimentorum TaxID=3041258 RepID=A0ABU1AHK4_9BACT|nr:hypothetical protein [Coraliomargarita sp. SDUM461004]MDQ8193266.1 hypothetical protein [Coraliomargarita sp. SDUM461004]
MPIEWCERVVAWRMRRRFIFVLMDWSALRTVTAWTEARLVGQGPEVVALIL